MILQTCKERKGINESTQVDINQIMSTSKIHVFFLLQWVYIYYSKLSFSLLASSCRKKEKKNVL